MQDLESGTTLDAIADDFFGNLPLLGNGVDTPCSMGRGLEQQTNASGLLRSAPPGTHVSLGLSLTFPC